jgi:hypothetical protein
MSPHSDKRRSAGLPASMDRSLRWSFSKSAVLLTTFEAQAVVGANYHLICGGILLALFALIFAHFST